MLMAEAIRDAALHFPAHAEVDGESRSDLPIVLRVEGVVFHGLGDGCAEADRAAGRRAEQPCVKPRLKLKDIPAAPCVLLSW